MNQVSCRLFGLAENQVALTVVIRCRHFPSKQMKHLILIVLLLPAISQAQPGLSGLGRYILGVTTPDSLDRIDFKEEEQAYAKGTLTLPCSHIRTFTSRSVQSAGVALTNLSLFFYEDTLFRIACDYSDELQEGFTLTYGQGTPRPNTTLLFCDQGQDKTMLIKGEVWQNGDIFALAAQAEGYDADCQMQQVSQLIIANQQITALTSECALQNDDSFSEEFDEMMFR